MIARLKERTPRGQTGKTDIRTYKYLVATYVLTICTAVLPPPPMKDLYDCAMYLHSHLKARRVDYYFCGGFACINVGMAARSTSDIDIAVPNGPNGFGVLLDIFSGPPFIQDQSGILPKDSYYFYVEASGNFVEVDGIIAGFMAFPEVDKAKIVQAGYKMQLNFLDPTNLLMLKLSSWANETRRNGPKKFGDMSDITSIRDLLISNEKSVDLVGLQGDMAKGLRIWIKEFNDLTTWRKLDKGCKD